MDSIFDVPYDSLDVEEVLFDYDGTLAMSGKPPKAVVELLTSLQETRTVRVFSNNHLQKRSRKKYFSKLGINYVSTYKPFGREELATKTVLVGDKFLTDGLYALRRGIPVYLIRKPWTWLYEWLITKLFSK